MTYIQFQLLAAIIINLILTIALLYSGWRLHLERMASARLAREIERLRGGMPVEMDALTAACRECWAEAFLVDDLCENCAPEAHCRWHTDIISLALRATKGNVR